MDDTFIAHKCNGKIWRPYPTVLCSMCHSQESFNLVFSSKKEYDEYIKEIQYDE